MKKIANAICKHKYLIVILTLILLIPSAIGFYKTKVNYDILVYLPEDIETLKGEHILTDDFNMGAFSIVALKNDTNLNALKLEEDIKKINGVDKVVSLYDVIGTSIPKEFLSDELTSKVSTKDTTLILVTFKNSTSDDITLDAVSNIRKIVSDKAVVGGMSAMVLDTKELFNSEMLLYVCIAVILCILVLMIFLDSYLVPILLILNIGIAILFNMGTNIFLGDISYITKAIASVLQLGVTTDFSIFLYHKYEDSKLKYKDKNEAMSNAIVATLTSVLGSSLTTIAGFLALCTMQLTLGADIGIVMAKGVLFGLVCVVTLFPALLLVFDKYIERFSHRPLVPKFTRVKKFIMKHYIAIFIIFVIVIIPAYIFEKNTDVYYKLDKSIPDNYGYAKATKLLKEDYNIVSQTMILISKDIPNYKTNKMIKEIEKLDGIDLVLSSSKLSTLGISEDIIDDDIKSIYSSDKYKLVLVNSNYEIATNKLNNQITKINKVVNKYDKKAIVAGEGPLMKDLVKVTDIDFHNVNYTSIFIIFILMLLVTKSISLPVLLVTTIEGAIFINMGIPYITGTKIPFIASIVIGTIQLGATIDYAILMTTKYLEQRKNNKEKFEAVKVALDSSVSSIFVSGMCFFAATIGVGVVSKIDMIGTLCTLISRGAIISMIIVIFVLPSVLLIFDSLIVKTTIGFKGGKKMNKKIALFILGLLLINPYCAKALTKDETVYAKLGKSGKVKSVLVTEHLINDEKLDNITDKTILKDIKNLNGNESYTLNGKDLTWKAKKNDIYYQGVTDKKLPISVNITYKIDGKKIKIKDAKGKSGHVLINIKYTNNLKENINGKTLYTPFVIVNELNLNSKYNSNIKVTNGKVISNGTTNAVVAVASPGLNESLSFDSINLNEINIEYDTTNFKASDIYAVATSSLLNDTDILKFSSFESVKGSINLLAESSLKLVKGTSDLNSGVDKLKEGATTLNSGINTALNGVKTLREKTDEGINNLKSELSNVLSDEYINGLMANIASKTNLTEEELVNIGNLAKAKLNENESYNNLVSQISSMEQNGINDDLVSACNSELKEQYKQTCDAYSNYIILYPVLKQMKSSIEATAYNTAITTASMISSEVPNKLKENIYPLVTDLKSKTTTITTQVDELSKGIKQLENGLNRLNDGSKSLVDGISSLKQGTNSMYQGMYTFNESGIKKLTNFVNNDLISKLENAKELVELSKNYSLFDEKEANTNTSTKFIFIIK